VCFFSKKNQIFEEKKMKKKFISTKKSIRYFKKKIFFEILKTKKHATLLVRIFFSEKKRFL